jgi:glyoxylase-like metal-dependent hydrolase (beta-lactamase superfamily II)
LASLGHGPDEIHLVINTHLHFDHAGGNTWRNEGGEVLSSFPNARFVVQRGEHHWATHTNERTGASYFVANWDPIIGADRFDFIEGEQEILPGIRSVPSPGHVPYHQSILVDGGNGAVAFFLGDVCPTASHLPLPWIMGYDVEPLVTLESKRRLLTRAAGEGWLMVFEHDASVTWSRIGHDGKAFGLRQGED